ncbi:hypothetical protein P7L53_08480 [Thermoleptolyngbya sichuanensis XZ-Cy5]|uniref:hypothetical protein n=1 Tax=Thermoleptolyngbya sichuanensis TaxID=2885951 RepID=UPI00240D53C9|nr:hypothetical protein [Thermoleptolyngbya sichuanensis]MDG2616279.1 hypothetical protein [Thermoleptolyngbya sichuanensis XZ-Cy5]
MFHIEAISENCPQHIPIRYSVQEVEAMMTPLRDRISALEQQLAQAADNAFGRQ